MECRMSDESPNLKQLKKLSKTLPTLDNFVLNKSSGQSVYRVESNNGKPSIAVGETLLSEPGVGIMRFKMEKGDKIEHHLHHENEWIILISGSFKTNIDGKENIIRSGGYIYYPPESGHSGTVLENLDCICITVPKAGGYPE